MVTLSISEGLVDFCKFDNFRRFSRNNSGKIYRSDLPMSEKDASRWDLNLGWQKFLSKINSSAGIFEKAKKMAKIAAFAHFEPLWSINANFSGHPVCGKMLGIWSGLTCRSNVRGEVVRLPQRPLKILRILLTWCTWDPRYTFSC